jgi:hypothetical protein
MPPPRLLAPPHGHGLGLPLQVTPTRVLPLAPTHAHRGRLPVPVTVPRGLILPASQQQPPRAMLPAAVVGPRPRTSHRSPQPPRSVTWGRLRGRPFAAVHGPPPSHKSPQPMASRPGLRFTGRGPPPSRKSPQPIGRLRLGQPDTLPLLPRLPPGVAHFVRLLPVPGPLIGLSAVSPAPPGVQRKRSSSATTTQVRPRAVQGLRYARIRTGSGPTAAALARHRSGGRPCCSSLQPFDPLPSDAVPWALASSVGTLPAPGPLWGGALYPATRPHTSPLLCVRKRPE